MEMDGVWYGLVVLSALPWERTRVKCSGDVPENTTKNVEMDINRRMGNDMYVMCVFLGCEVPVC